MSDASPVFVLNIPGLDRRRVDADAMPFIAGLLGRYPVVEWDGQPTTEIWPSLVTGANPGKHDIWHCKVDWQPRDAKPGALEKLPDPVAKTVQLFRHLKDSGFDMPCIPPWRRKHLAFHRLKFNVRGQPEHYRTVGGLESIFGVLGDDAAYRMIGRFEQFFIGIEGLPTPGLRLEWLEVHAYDIAVHYYADRPEVMKRRGAELDELARTLHDRCVAAGVTFALVVDHGQEDVTGQIDLIDAVERSGADREDVTYFVALGVTKFWFRTPEARQKVAAALELLEHMTVLDWRELNARCDFTLGPEWGELYAIADHDRVFFPHDFHHPLANLHAGLTNTAMRRRLTSPHQVAYHGQMPGAVSEVGFLLVADDAWTPAVPGGNGGEGGAGGKARIKDVAPTLLSMVGAEPAGHMDGDVVVRSAEVLEAIR